MTVRNLECAVDNFEIFLLTDLIVHSNTCSAFMILRFVLEKSRTLSPSSTLVIFRPVADRYRSGNSRLYSRVFEGGLSKLSGSTSLLFFGLKS